MKRITYLFACFLVLFMFAGAASATSTTVIGVNNSDLTHWHPLYPSLECTEDVYNIQTAVCSPEIDTVYLEGEFHLGNVSMATPVEERLGYTIAITEGDKTFIGEEVLVSNPVVDPKTGVILEGRTWQTKVNGGWLGFWCAGPAKLTVRKLEIDGTMGMGVSARETNGIEVTDCKITNIKDWVVITPDEIQHRNFCIALSTSGTGNPPTANTGVVTIKDNYLVPNEDYSLNGNYSAGIWSCRSDFDSVTATGNVIDGYRHGGIAVMFWGKEATISNNYITENQPYNKYAQWGGIYVGGGVSANGKTGSAVIKNNKIVCNGLFSYAGIELDQGSPNSSYYGDPSYLVENNDITMTSYIYPYWDYGRVGIDVYAREAGYDPRLHYQILNNTLQGQFWYGMRIDDMYNGTVMGNTITGTGNYYGIYMYLSPYNTIKDNDLEDFAAISSQIFLRTGSDNSLVTGNKIGKIDADDGVTGILCLTDNNSIVQNEFRNSEIMGVRNGNLPCVLLHPRANDNDVFEQGDYPVGTGGATFQVVDYGTNNRVVGHPADAIAQQEDANPGIGDLLKSLAAEADAQAVTEKEEEPPSSL